MKHVPKRLKKYVAQRYRLFHLFDEGIKLDEESWFSTTPEKIAAHIAERFIGRNVILDLFSGAGGNTIQFAKAGAFVISVEKSRERIEIAKNNAKVYGVDQFIEFVHGDVYEFLPALVRRKCPIDAVFMSPPWGGPEYLNNKYYDVGLFTKVVAMAKQVSPNVAILVPRNVEPTNLLLHFGPCELERNSLSGKVKTITIYFGGLVTIH